VEQILSNLCHIWNQIHFFFFKAGVLEPLILMLDSNNPVTQTCGLSVIATLCINKLISLEIVTEKNLHRTKLIELLNSEHVSVVEEALRTTLILSRDYKKNLWNANFLPVLTKKLEHEDPIIKRNAISSIENLITTAEEALTFSKFDPLVPLINSIPIVPEVIFSTLYNLSQNEDVTIMMLDLGILTKISELLKTQFFILSEDTIQKISKFIINICFQLRATEKFLSQPGFQYCFSYLLQNEIVCKDVLNAIALLIEREQGIYKYKIETQKEIIIQVKIIKDLQTNENAKLAQQILESFKIKDRLQLLISTSDPIHKDKISEQVYQSNLSKIFFPPNHLNTILTLYNHERDEKKQFEPVTLEYFFNEK